MTEMTKPVIEVKIHDAYMVGFMDGVARCCEFHDTMLSVIGDIEHQIAHKLGEEPQAKREEINY